MYKISCILRNVNCAQNNHKLLEYQAIRKRRRGISPTRKRSSPAHTTFLPEYTASAIRFLTYIRLSAAIVPSFQRWTDVQKCVNFG